LFHREHSDGKAGNMDGHHWISDPISVSNIKSGSMALLMIWLFRFRLCLFVFHLTEKNEVKRKNKALTTMGRRAKMLPLPFE
jgi:hypothetical protein